MSLYPSQLDRADLTIADSGLAHIVGPSAALVNALEAEWQYLARMPTHVRVHYDRLRDALEGVGR